MKKNLIIVLFVLVSSIALFGGVPTYFREAGLYGSEDLMRDVVYQFTQHFSAEMLEWTIATDWTDTNNTTPYGVDTFDFVYFCGHGAPYTIQMRDFGLVDLRTAGSTNQSGYGDYALENLVLESCEVVPSPIDIADPYTPWLSEPGGIFDGLHNLCGFRTSAYISTSYNIANYMGYLTFNNVGTVISNWINAVETYGAGDTLDKYCVYSAYRNGYFDNPSWDAYYDVYGVSECNDSQDQGLWTTWSE
jgi:hypothetical protein